MNMKNALKRLEDFIGKYARTEYDIKLNLLKFVYLKYLIDNAYFSDEHIDEIRRFREFSLAAILRFRGHTQGQIAQDSVIVFSKEDHLALSQTLFWESWFAKEDFDRLIKVMDAITSHKAEKKRGAVYTPANIITLMLKLSEEKITSASKLADPACGNGAFLLKAYERYDALLKQDMPDSFARHQKILSEHLYGCDIDPLAVLCTKLLLSLKHRNVFFSENICCQDVLLSTPWEGESFDMVMTNPPYVGHKHLSLAYMELLKRKYKEVFENKSDLSFCFVALAQKLLKPDGIIAFFTSRYFLEAYSSAKLRAFLLKHFTFRHIIDFYGVRILKNIGIDSVIFVAQNRPASEEDRIEVKKAVFENRRNISSEKLTQSLLGGEAHRYFQEFSFEHRHLSASAFHLINDEERAIVQKIEEASFITLSDILEDHQGIITGLDKAFVLDDKDSTLLLFDKQNLKPWIKNSDIRPYILRKNRYWLLYANDIDPAVHQAEMRHLLPYKDRLMRRRECVKGTLPWHYLQWGRNKTHFDIPKIVFPYKAENNAFALDTGKMYFSADVYALTLKSYAYPITYEYLCILLNSRLYDFYYKTFAKKLGEKMYEYYPNMVLRLKVPLMKISEEAIYGAYRQLLVSVGTEQYEENIENLNDFVYKLFDLTEAEIEYVQSKYETKKNLY